MSGFTKRNNVQHDDRISPVSEAGNPTLGVPPPTRNVRSSALPSHPQAHLQMPLQIIHAGNSPECRRSRAQIRPGKSAVVECVESFHPELQIDALFNAR